MGKPDSPGKSTGRQPTLQIVGIYLFIGGAWVLAARELLFQQDIDPSHLPVLHTLEGWAFLLGTAALFYFLISRYLRTILHREATKIDALVSDISVQKHLVEALDQAREHYRLLFEQMAQGVIYLDGDGQILAVNPAAEKILGISSGDLLGRNSIDPEGKALRADGTPLPADESPFRQALLTCNEVRDMIVGLFNPIEGNHRWISVDAVPQLQAGESRPFQVLATLNDITERRQAEEKVQNLAFYDSLTGLPNRRLLLDRLRLALAQARREGTLVGMAFLDLDGFKTINDTLGHATGDTLLQEVAGRLQQTVRGSDTVARLGGDEFVVILNNLENADVAATIAEKILAIFASPFPLGGSEIFSTASIGLALYPLDASCEEDLLRRADLAMYRAKERGRNHYQFYAPQMNDEAMQRLELHNSLNLALRRDELVLFFQEMISLKTDGIIGVEALLRWRHPDRGLLLPAEFLPLAEESGLILPIGEWVLRSACVHARAWQRMGLPQLRISINVSTRQLRHGDLVEMVRRETANAGLLPTSLDLEFREESLLEEQARIPETLAALKEMGVGCTLDDFGTGLSAIGRLRSYPVDRIKIHQSLIQNFAAAENAGLIQGIVDLAHTLHLQVVAEGVETGEQKAFLQSLGCDEVQGFHFRRPVPAEKLSELLDGTRSE